MQLVIESAGMPEATIAVTFVAALLFFHLDSKKIRFLKCLFSSILLQLAGYFVCLAITGAHLATPGGAAPRDLSGMLVLAAACCLIGIQVMLRKRY